MDNGLNLGIYKRKKKLSVADALRSKYLRTELLKKCKFIACLHGIRINAYHKNETEWQAPNGRIHKFVPSSKI